MKKGTLKEQRVASDLLQHVGTVLKADAMNNIFFKYALNPQGCKKRKISDDFKERVYERVRGYNSLEYTTCELDRSLHHPTLPSNVERV